MVIDVLISNLQLPIAVQIILIGMKSSGKTTVGRLLAARMGVPFVDVDAALEQVYAAQTGEQLTFREIFGRNGRSYFRNLEKQTLQHLQAQLREQNFVLATGGGLPLDPDNRPILPAMGRIIFLDVAESALLPRIIANGIPAFFPYPDDPARSLTELLAQRRPIYESLANLTIHISYQAPDKVVTQIIICL